jgi:hypothetical protein
MNTETETTVSHPETTQGSNIQTVDFSSEAKRIHRKIAKLPKPLRDLINASLDDGLPALEIITKLQASTNPPLPYPITEVDISRWKNSGYQRYLAHQDHLDSIQASRDAALEMVANNNLSLPQATLQVIAAQCFEILADFSPVAVKQKLAENPLKYTSFLHVFARLTREMVHLEKYQDARAGAEAKKLDPDRDFSDSETLVWAGRMDRAFHRKDPRRLKTKTSKPPESDPTLTPTLTPTPTHTPPTPSSSNSPHESCITDHETGSIPFHPSHASHPPSSLQAPASPQIENLEEHCLDCHHPLPTLTPEGKRPFERCQICNVILPPPGTCTRPSADKCQFCGATLPRRLPNGRRPKPNCHNCGIGLGRELDEDIQKFAEE